MRQQHNDISQGRATDANPAGSAATGQDDRGQQSDPTFVINLCSSMMPIGSGNLPERALLEQYQLYQSHRYEDGRERFRLHLGFFTSDADAMHVLSLVREIFPTAWIVRACADDLRHFDPDRPIPVAPSPISAGDEIEVDDDALGELPVAHEAGCGQAARGEECYAVQLEWSPRHFDRESLPDLPAGESYKLYTIETTDMGSRWYGLRLGFFETRSAAEQVCRDVHDRFSFATVAFVDATEHGLAMSAADPLGEHIAVTAPSVDTPLATDDADESAGAGGTGSGSDQDRAASERTHATSRRNTIERAKTSPADRRRKRRRSALDLAAAEMVAADPDYRLSDTAKVRHLQVKVKRASAATRLFGRWKLGGK